MKPAVFFCLFLFTAIPFDLLSQDSLQMAEIRVQVTNKKNQPRRGEVVIFSAQRAGRDYTAVTAARGDARIFLPVGDSYRILLRTFNDTSVFSQLEIPEPGEDEFYAEPFVIDIMYEPARSFTLDNVHFDTGKPALRPESRRELDEIAEYMLLKENGYFEIAGHTDNVGSDADNIRLSLARAESVRAYLVSKGVDPRRLTAKGYGASRPVADNNTPEGRQRNRRTEVIIMD